MTPAIHTDAEGEMDSDNDLYDDDTDEDMTPIVDLFAARSGKVGKNYRILGPNSKKVANPPNPKQVASSDIGQTISLC